MEFTAGWSEADDQMGLGIAGTTDADLAFKFPLLTSIPSVKPTFPRGLGIGIPFGGEVVRILTEDPIVARTVNGGHDSGSLNLTVYSLSTVLF